MLEDAVHRPCLSVPLAAEDQPEDEIAHDETMLRAALGRDSLTQYQEIVSCGAPRRRAVSLPMKRKALPVAKAAAISLAFVRMLPRAMSDHAHALAGGTPILALAMYDHSYHMDYGAKAAAYVDAFMRSISWDSASQRLSQEPGVES